MTETYHVLKATEGGPGGTYAAQLAKEYGGTRITQGPSCYVGHTCVTFTATKAQHEAYAKALWGQ